MSNFIYLVFQGERFEGGAVKKIFNNYESALEEVYKTARCLSFSRNYESDFNYWQCGGHYITIQKWSLLTGSRVELNENSPEFLKEIEQ